MKERLKKPHIVHSGAFMDVREDEVELPNKKPGKRLYVDHPGGAAVLAITPEKKVIMIKQYRYAVGTYLYEIPAGKNDDQDDPILTARRELAEETGYGSNDIKLLTRIYPTPGYSNEIIDIFIAQNAYELSDKINGDDDEYITVEIFDQNEIKKFIETQKIIDAKTLIALQYYLSIER